MRLLPLNALRVFLVVAEHLSFTAAARQLHLTQGAVSRQIQTLEGHYATPLFLRHARGLALTAEGLALLPAVRKAFDLLAEAGEALRASQGDIRLRVPPTPAMRWILPNLPDFRSRFPAYTLHLMTHTQTSGYFDRAECDVAIEGLVQPGMETGLVYDCINREQLVPVCSPALLEGGPTLACPNDLRHFTLLHPWRGQDGWRQWLQLAGADQVDPDGGIQFDALEYALHAAVRGMGVSLAQVSMIGEDVARGRLVQPFGLVLETDWAYYLVYAEESAALPKIQAFRSWLFDVLAT
ncbi:LysR substrate-binding domain-containing protein [Paludibacterium yongneupense]|uniref:LysR substrate-binding domain-containing protein n=1 Tax=Paludibacterium yongneupense TaxID=400061 RepID=UPI000404A340|nr:LysR substrate-binding domain-containing protein [Paludibacterium yongneupense]